jgi:hypothetical protein
VLWSRGWTGGRGDHVLKAGFAAARTSVDGQIIAREVAYLRSDGSVSKRIGFSGAGLVQATDGEAGAFVEDSWTPHARFKIDMGVRWDYAGVFSSHAAGPRAVLTYTIDEHTKLSGSGGYFTAKPVLNVGIFSQRQSRRLTAYDASGQPIGDQTYQNAADDLTVPGSAVAHIQVDRTLNAEWTVRAAYQERHGRREMVVDPVAGADGNGVLSLTATGTSRTRIFEATVGYRAPSATRQFYASYVRASSVGNLNDVNTITGTLATPLVLADTRAPLAADVPHRILAWGIIALPWRLTFAPFLEIRSGFPYTPIDEDWNPVRARNSGRFPLFASLDIAIEKALQLPVGPPLRLGIKFFNLTGRHNGRDIQPDVQRADYGQTFNPVRRQFRASLEIVWNKG